MKKKVTVLLLVALIIGCLPVAASASIDENTKRKLYFYEQYAIYLYLVMDINNRTINLTSDMVDRGICKNANVNCIATDNNITKKNVERIESLIKIANGCRNDLNKAAMAWGYSTNITDNILDSDAKHVKTLWLIAEDKLPYDKKGTYEELVDNTLVKIQNDIWAKETALSNYKGSAVPEFFEILFIIFKTL